MFSCAAFASWLLCSSRALLLCHVTSTQELKSPFVLSSASHVPKMKLPLRLIKMLRPAMRSQREGLYFVQSTIYCTVWQFFQLKRPLHIYVYVSFYQCAYHWFSHIDNSTYYVHSIQASWYEPFTKEEDKSGFMPLNFEEFWSTTRTA